VTLEGTHGYLNSYFVPHDELRRALRDAAKRGVDVKLILPGHSDSWITYYAGRAYYEERTKEAAAKTWARLL
jgi:cardiolipin synthase